MTQPIGQPLNLPRPAICEAEVRRVLDGANRLAILMGGEFVPEPWKLRRAGLSEASVARVCGGGR